MREYALAQSGKKTCVSRVAFWAGLAIVFAMISSGKSQTADSARQTVTPANRPVILITGSTSGLGREVALRLAATGAHIIVHGRNRERGLAVVNEIEKGGKGTARFYAADLASFAQVRAFGATILKDYQRLDVLINNAGIWLRNATTR